MRLISLHPAVTTGVMLLASLLIPALIAALIDPREARDKRAVWLAALFVSIVWGGVAYASGLPYNYCAVCEATKPAWYCWLAGC